MAPSQRARSAVPPDNRSFFSSIAGIPAWGAVLVAIGMALLGIYLDTLHGTGTDLTRTFTVCYLAGCGMAVVAVQRKAIFTALVQPPIVLFLAVPLAYLYFAEDKSNTKALVLAAIPLFKRFPLMMTATIVVLLIGVFRLLTTKPNPVSIDEDAPRRRTTPPQDPTLWAGGEPVGYRGQATFSR